MTNCLAFRDVNPQAPVHILVIPKQPIARLIDAVDDDQSLLGHLLLSANKIALEQDIGEAFRLVVNNGGRRGVKVFFIFICTFLPAGRSPGRRDNLKPDIASHVRNRRFTDCYH